jgi:hypothetical protein
MNETIGKIFLKGKEMRNAGKYSFCLPSPVACIL